MANNMIISAIDYKMIECSKCLHKSLCIGLNINNSLAKAYICSICLLDLAITVLKKQIENFGYSSNER